MAPGLAEPQLLSLLVMDRDRGKRPIVTPRAALPVWRPPWQRYQSGEVLRLATASPEGARRKCARLASCIELVSAAVEVIICSLVRDEGENTVRSLVDLCFIIAE